MEKPEKVLFCCASIVVIKSVDALLVAKLVSLVVPTLLARGHLTKIVTHQPDRVELETDIVGGEALFRLLKEMGAEEVDYGNL